MIIREDFSGAEERLDAFLTIGFFDGVHLGHQKIIGEVVKKANLSNVQSCVITFDRHPSELFSGRKVKLLTSREEKEEIFRSLGVGVVQVFTFNPRFARLSPEEFLERLSSIFNIQKILVGEEFAFGFKREGNVNFLYQNQVKFGYKLEAIPPLRLNGEKISSSMLREWLKKGEIRKVKQGLGRSPTVVGEVITGKRKGREIGYPTANLKPHPQKLLPGSGVYAGYVKLEGKIYKALINIGGRPTFGDFAPGIEVHIINFSGELYGKVLKIDLVERIRDTRLFLSPFHLSQQIREDRERAEKILEDYNV